MDIAPAVTTVKRTYRLLAALFAVLGVVFLWLATVPDGGFFKGFFQGGGAALIVMAVFWLVSTLR